MHNILPLEFNLIILNNNKFIIVFNISIVEAITY